MLYDLARSLLFRFEPETAHRLTLKALRLATRVGMAQRVPVSARTVMGIEFPNPVGLAAGLDKNAEHIDALSQLGFGFIEVGTVTPRPQPGNPRPRMFRLPQARALINRLGFNNQGLDYLLDRVERSSYRGVLGINLGKNFDTPVEKAAQDYLTGLRRVYARASYVTVNISSPNTPGLRDLQYGETLDRLLEALKEEQLRLATEHGRYVPLAVKIAPDLSDDDISTVARAFIGHEIDGVIATNTTFSRKGVEGLPHADEAGGLSGAPLMPHATEVVRLLHQALEGRLPIIAVGGIMSGGDARTKIEAGADLVQIYTGLIYRGPALIREIVEALR